MMSNGNEFANDVFISYSSDDSIWAQKLNDSLRGKGLHTFFAPESLRAGDDWENQVLIDLNNSRNLVVLWSLAAKNSDWVSRELYRFDAIIHPGTEEPLVGRRIVILVLEGEPTSMKRYQMIFDLKETEAYQAGSERVDESLWRQVADKIETALGADDEREPIPLVVLTMTRERLLAIDSSQRAGFSDSLDAVLNQIQIGTITQLGASYGDSRFDWQPFGSPRTIKNILDELLDTINLRSTERKFRWQPISDELWSDELSLAEAAAEELATRPSVVVLDPLAIYDDQVKERLIRWLWKWFRNKRALILVPAPFSKPQPYHELKNLIQSASSINMVFHHFYEESPLRMGKMNAFCSAKIDDEHDILRWLMRVLGPTPPEEIGERSNFLKVTG